MIQKSNPRWERKEPWKFVPRRDLFPDREVHEGINQSKLRIKGKEPLKPWISDLVRTPDLLLVLLVTVLLRNSKQVVRKVFDHPQSIQLLKSIGPYLDKKEQNIVYTVAGLMEAAQLINDVANHNYHNQNQITLMNIPSDPAARRIEALKAIKSYINPENRKQLDRFLNFYDGIRKVQHNFAKYRHKLNRDTPVQTVSEFLRVIQPILPEEQKIRIDKAMKVMKMIEVMGNKEEDKEGKINLTKKEEEKTNERENKKQLEKIMNSFTPMLNEEQKESMNMIMKMAELLSQTD